MSDVILILVCVALVVVVVIGERRHARLRRRVREMTVEARQQAARTDRTERHVYARMAEDVVRGAVKAPALPPPRVKFLSQFGEDAYLWDLFEGKLDGFFIEVGAFDGVNLSTTYALEAVGWTGLLVEPLAARFETCRRERPRSCVVHAAVGKRGASGTVRFSALESAEDPLIDIASSMELPEFQKNLAAEANARVRVEEVRLVSLAELLRGMPGGGPQRIDVAVIDVEGFERDAIDGLELEVNRPRVLLVEDLTRGEEKAAAGMLRDAGYVEVAMFWCNRVWVDGREPELVRRGRMLGEGGAVKRGL